MHLKRLAAVFILHLHLIFFIPQLISGRTALASFRGTGVNASMNSVLLSHVENGFADRAGLEQGETQQHRVSGALPDGNVQIRPAPDLSHQYGVDRHADHDEKPLQP